MTVSTPPSARRGVIRFDRTAFTLVELLVVIAI
ncbi:MAG: type II secretion system protein, partial [Planctomycetota bacterium]